MPSAPLGIADLLTVARGFAARAEAAGDEIEAGRRLPADLAAYMARAGLFRLLVPRSLGGAELDFPDYLKIVTVFAGADGSAAWCINQNNVFATNSARIPQSTAHEIWDDPLAVVTNGPPTPESLAVPVDGGYTLTGRWNFSSGIQNATWVAALAPVVRSGDDRSPMTKPEAGITALIPKGDVEILDVWDVSGLRGTGSLSFTLADHFVTSSRTFGPADPPNEDGAIYVIPTVLMFAAGFGTVSLGIARSALDTAIDLSAKKTPVMTEVALGDLSTTRRRIGEAEAALGSSKAFLTEAVSDLWAEASDSRELTVEARIRLRLAGTHAIRTSADVVDAAYNLAGADSIFATNPIQRRFQDMHVITQQAQGRMAHYDTAGAFYLGQSPSGFF